MGHIIKKAILFLIIISIANFVYCQDIEEQAKEHYRIGEFYYRQARYKEAQEEFQKALDYVNQKEILASKKEMLPARLPQTKKSVPEKEQLAVEYIIAEADIIDISLWQHPDLQQDTIVRPDGRISFPLIGDIQASGLSLTQLDERLTERLKEYIRHPEVSISIKKLGGRKVIVLGQIRNPGVYSVTGERTILEAIALAGGFTNHAASSSVILIRGGFEAPEAKRINLTLAIKKGGMHQNIVLDSEDIVFVPKKFIADLNYFLNQILDPISKGAYTAREIQHW